MAGRSDTRRRLLGAAGIGAIGVAGATGLLWGARDRARAAAPPPPSAHVRAILAGEQWLNTQTSRAPDLDNKVVVVNFWTYSCINSLRTLPYLRAWADKYRDRGLVVIGVHSPEFRFEHEVAHVRRAVGDERVNYPVVLDNGFTIWDAFENNAWPGFFFLDRQGRVRHRAMGEGRYDQLERWIQELLSEDASPVREEIVEVTGAGAQAPPDWRNIGSPETYLGYAKASGFEGQTRLAADTSVAYRPAVELGLNRWTFGGRWNVGPEYATAIASDGIIRFRFRARDLHLVLGRDSNAEPIAFRVRIDGAAAADARGADVDAGGAGLVDEPRMYQLVRQQGDISQRNFEIAFLSPGARAYAFTFG